jgi:hypothetical protein
VIVTSKNVSNAAIDRLSSAFKASLQGLTRGTDYKYTPPSGQAATTGVMPRFAPQNANPYAAFKRPKVDTESQLRSVVVEMFGVDVAE